MGMPRETGVENHAWLILKDLGRGLDAVEARRIIGEIVNEPLTIDPSNRVPKASGKKKPRHTQRYFWLLASTRGTVTSVDAEPHVQWLLSRLRCDGKRIAQLTDLGQNLEIVFYWTVDAGQGRPLSWETQAELSNLHIQFTSDLDD